MKTEFNAEALGKNIKRLCKLEGMKISQLEKLVGVSTGYISRISRSDSKYNPGVDLICKIAEVFDITVDELLRPRTRQRRIEYLAGLGVTSLEMGSAYDTLSAIQDALNDNIFGVLESAGVAESADIDWSETRLVENGHITLRVERKRKPKKEDADAEH